MGVCDSNNNFPHINKGPGIFHKQTFGDPLKDGYKFGFNGENNFTTNKNNLTFIFYNFKIKYCISHSPTKESFYITEITIGNKTYPPIITKGCHPDYSELYDINKGIIEQNDFTLDELKNTFLLINVYEYFDDISPNVAKNSIQSNALEEYKQKSNYNSFFRISLDSFIYKPERCDFPMMGTNQLSKKTRISFNCKIEHREQIVINGNNINNPNLIRMCFRTKSCKLNSEQKNANNYFSVTTPPMTMSELQKSDIFLEEKENINNYNYISLNNIKADIIAKLCYKVLKDEITQIFLRNPIDIRTSNINNSIISNMSLTKNEDVNQINKNLSLSNIFTAKERSYKITPDNQGYYNDSNLIFENLPMMAQFHNLYLTEFGNIFSTALLNLKNDDQDVINYRNEQKISSHYIYEKLNKCYMQISQEDYEFNILNEICTILLKSVDNEKFYILYPSMNALNTMVLLFMKLAILIVEKIKISSLDYQNLMYGKVINILMKREEMDNCILAELLYRNATIQNTEFQKIFNIFFLSLFNLYMELLSNKFYETSIEQFLDLFSRLYFRNSYLRRIILTSLYGRKYNFNSNNLTQNDVLIYDTANDNKVCSYLTSDTKNGIKKILKSDFLLSQKSFDNYLLLKKIISLYNDININQYPFDFTLFTDNINILHIIERDITSKKYKENDKIGENFVELCQLLSNNYIAISRINNNLIQSINLHDNYSIYIFFDYLKSLFEYYYACQGEYNVIIDYSILESADIMLAENENSVSLPRLFWFYYFCAHMTTSGHMKWFIINIMNKYFDRFAYHWSFTIRQIYFKVLIYIIIYRLKQRAGKFFNKEKISPFFDDKKVHTEPYVIQSIKDFKLISTEFLTWKDMGQEEFPPFFLPPPIPSNGIIE